MINRDTVDVSSALAPKNDKLDKFTPRYAIARPCWIVSYANVKTKFSKTPIVHQLNPCSAIFRSKTYFSTSILSSSGTRHLFHFLRIFQLQNGSIFFYFGLTASKLISQISCSFHIGFSSPMNSCGNGRTAATKLHEVLQKYNCEHTNWRLHAQNIEGSVAFPMVSFVRLPALRTHRGKKKTKWNIDQWIRLRQTHDPSFALYFKFQNKK